MQRFGDLETDACRNDFRIMRSYMVDPHLVKIETRDDDETKGTHSVSISCAETHPVSQKAANAWGLLDMMGNVYEWCADWSGDYSIEIVTDPAGPSSSSVRVFRGGGWTDAAGDVRSADRDGVAPGASGSFLGFRPVLSSVR
jgi:formylglycine-generating enzyme required for sulfatase activity